MHRIVGLIIVVLLSLCPLVSSEENNDTVNQDNTIESSGPDFFFDCREEASRPAYIPTNRLDFTNQVRQDLPSGDIVRHLGCIIENPNDFNITVELTVSPDVDIWSPDEYCLVSYSYRYDYQNREWGYFPDTYCNYGQWVISSQMGIQSYSIELSKNENLYPHFSIYADSLLYPMQPGWNEINLTTRITKTQWAGDNETLCVNCSTINYTSTQFFNEWWNVIPNTDSGLGWCGYYWSNIGLFSGEQGVTYSEICQDEEMLDATNRLYSGDFIFPECDYQQKYTDFGYHRSGQYITNCETRINTYWETLLNSNKLDRAKLLEDGEDWDDWYWNGNDQFQDYRDETENSDDEIDYWDSRECPEQFPIAYTFDVMGNSNLTRNGEIQLISHEYNLLNGHSTIHNLSNHTFEISSNNGYDFVSIIPLTLSEEDNYLVVLESRVIIENESYEETIFGSCLTELGVKSLNEIFEEAELTMGLTGGPLQRFSNSISYNMGVDSFVVVGFFSMCIPPILYFVLTRLVRRVNEEF